MFWDVEPKLSKSKFFSAWAWVGLAASVGVMLIASQVDHRTLDGNGQIVGDGGVVVLDPTQWIGSELPIKQYITPPRKKLEGRWNVLIVDKNCSVCQENFEAFVNVCQAPLIVLEMSSKAGDKAILASEKFERLKLVSEIQWFAEVPIQVSIVDGVVTHVVEREALLESIGK